MKEIWEPALKNRIDNFMSRKAEEFPELGLKDRWSRHIYAPKKHHMIGGRTNLIS